MNPQATDVSTLLRNSNIENVVNIIYLEVTSTVETMKYSSMLQIRSNLGQCFD